MKKRRPAFRKAPNIKKTIKSSNETGRRGALPRRRTLGKAWLLAHRRACAESAAKLMSTPLGTLMTVLVIAVALSLPSAFLLILENGKEITSGWEGERLVSVYLKVNSSKEEIADLQSTLQQQSDVWSLEYISPDDAITEFGRDAGFGDALALLVENPLPPLMVLKLRPDADPLAQARRLQHAIQKLPNVDYVDVDMEWIKRLELLLETGRRVGIALACLIAMGVLLVIGNTIRLDILNQRAEIVIIKRVGGTQAFIRRPFLYTGLFYGAAGSVLAWILVTSGLALIRDPVVRLTQSFESGFELHGMGVNGSIQLLLAGLLLGLVGSWISVSRHLRMIEPT